MRFSLETLELVKKARETAEKMKVCMEIRAVLDTNVVLAAEPSSIPDSPNREVVRRWLAGSVKTANGGRGRIDAGPMLGLGDEA